MQVLVVIVAVANPMGLLWGIFAMLGAETLAMSIVGGASGLLFGLMCEWLK
jgi:hypothetical protein